AWVANSTAPADRLSLLYLQQSRTGCPDGEEQLRVLISAGGTVAPVHGGNTPWFMDHGSACSARPLYRPLRQRYTSVGGCDRPGRQGGLVLRLLLNAFTDYRCVKGEHRQKTLQVMDVT